MKLHILGTLRVLRLSEREIIIFDVFSNFLLYVLLYVFRFLNWIATHLQTSNTEHETNFQIIMKHWPTISLWPHSKFYCFQFTKITVKITTSFSVVRCIYKSFRKPRVGQGKPVFKNSGWSMSGFLLNHCSIARRACT